MAIFEPTLATRQSIQQIHQLVLNIGGKQQFLSCIPSIDKGRNSQLKPKLEFYIL